ncbi:MAG: TolC family protein [Caulobacterales bacterium]
MNDMFKADPRIWSGALAAALALTACTPTVKPITGPVATKFSEPDSALAPADLSVWWTAFDDPLLNKVVDESFAQNITLQQAVLRVREARALGRQTIAGVLPTLDAVGSVTSTEALDGPGLVNSTGGFDDRQTTAVYGPSAIWEVPLFGRIQAAGVGYKGTILAATAAARGTRATLAADAAQAYVDLRAAQSRAQLLDQSATALESIRAANQKQVDAGILSTGDFARTQSLAANARARAETAQAVLRRALDRVAVLRGIAPGTDALEAELAKTAPVPNFTAGAPRSTPANLLRARPDIAQAEAAALQQAALVGVARNDLLPQLTLGGQINIYDTVSGQPFSGGGTQGVLNAAVSMPLWDWGSRLANVTVQKSRFKSAMLGYRDTVNNAVAEAQGALATFARTQRAADLARESEAAAFRRDNAQAALYRVGISSLNDRLDATNDLITARLDRTAAEADAAAAAIAVYRAFGGAAQPPKPTKSS